MIKVKQDLRTYCVTARNQLLDMWARASESQDKEDLKVIINTLADAIEYGEDYENKKRNEGYRSKTSDLHSEVAVDL